MAQDNGQAGIDRRMAESQRVLAQQQAAALASQQRALADQADRRAVTEAVLAREQTRGQNPAN